MVELFTRCDEDYGKRVSEGLKEMASFSMAEKAEKAVGQAEGESTGAKAY